MKEKTKVAVSIRARLFAATTVMGALMAAIVLFAIWQLNHLNDEFKQTVDVTGKKIILASRMKEKLLELSNAEKNIILSNSAARMTKESAVIDDRFNAIQRAGKELEPLLDDMGRTLLDNFSAQLAKLVTANLQIVALARTSIRSESKEQYAEDQAKRDLAAYQLSWKQSRPALHESRDLLDQIIERSVVEMAKKRSDMTRVYHSSRFAFLVFGLIGIVLGITFSYLIGERIVKDLSKLASYAELVRYSGDLSHPLPRLRQDEIGDLAESFDHMRMTLHEKDSLLLHLNNKLAVQNKELEQFVYTVSHDLKAPLVTCRGFVGLLKEDLAEGKINAVRDAAERIDGACEKMSGILDDLLSLSRIGRRRGKTEPVDVTKVVKELVDAMGQQFSEKGVEVEVQDQMPIVEADRISVERVFENLLTNALKYGSGGEKPRISVGAVPGDDEIFYYVEDNGQGIPPEYQEKIFGLFQRLEMNGEGSGVGLASVAKVMEIHDGSAWVESDVGEGATFWLSFPNKVY